MSGTAKALSRLRLCPGSLKPLPVAYVITLFSCISSFLLQIRGTKKEKTRNHAVDEQEESKDLESDYKKRLSFRCSGICIQTIL